MRVLRSYQSYNTTGLLHSAHAARHQAFSAPQRAPISPTQRRREILIGRHLIYFRPFYIAQRTAALADELISAAAGVFIEIFTTGLSLSDMVGIEFL